MWLFFLEEPKNISKGPAQKFRGSSRPEEWILWRLAKECLWEISGWLWNIFGCNSIVGSFRHIFDLNVSGSSPVSLLIVSVVSIPNFSKRKYAKDSLSNKIAQNKCFGSTRGTFTFWAILNAFSIINSNGFEKRESFTWVCFFVFAILILAIIAGDC